MTDSALITTGLPIALAIIMFGLGLSLTPADFRRVFNKYPRAPAAIESLTVSTWVSPVYTKMAKSG